MTDNVIRREVQRRDDPFGIPSCFYWTVDEVADWIDSIGYGKYKENFRSHFINGRKLLTVDACVLPRLGITNFGDILNLMKAIECIQSYRVTQWEDLPYNHMPRVFKVQLATSGCSDTYITNLDLPRREDRFTQAAVSWPWEYLEPPKKTLRTQAFWPC